MPEKEETKEKVVEMTDKEFFSIAHRLENNHSVFYKFWEMGKPVFTNRIPTAAVTFDPKSHQPVSFLFNPDFWQKQDDNQKDFIISHEMLHIILNHGIRIQDADKINFSLINGCLDVVINELLVDKFRYNKKRVDSDSNLCWLDTVFNKKNGYTGPKPKKAQSFEYYYNLAKTYLPKVEIPQMSGFMSGKGGKGDKESSQKGKPHILDSHEKINSDDFKEILDELNDVLPDEEKSDLKDMIDKHFEEDEKEDGTQGGVGGKEAGTGSSNAWTFAKVDAKKVKKKKKWESVIKKWVSRKCKNQFKDTEQWARCNRRFIAMADQDLMIPTEMEVEDVFWDENSIDVWFFLDTSGSCYHLKDRFFKAAASLPPEKFNVRLFCFDTQVFETSLETKKLYGFGGTSFHILESSIQATMKKEKVKYPEAVFVITDGYGNAINPQKPEKWFWFLSDDYRHYIPKASHIFMLKDYE